MAKRHKEWARRKRRELIRVLGGRCSWCGTRSDLEFDCVVPCGDEHHRLATDSRISFYFRQYRERNLQVLCQKCNARKGDGPNCPGWFSHYAAVRRWLCRQMPSSQMELGA